MDALLPDINVRIAMQVRRLRGGLGLSLDLLAAHSGVSRSMISLIERGEANPTAVVLERLAFGLGVPLAQLFDASLPDTPNPTPLSRQSDQHVWEDPASGYRRRNVSPPQWPSPFRIVAVEFPAGAQVAYETGAREPVIDQQVWVLHGQIEVTLGSASHTLGQGDCLAFRLDQPVAFANRSLAPAHYAVVLGASAPPAPRGER